MMQAAEDGPRFDAPVGVDWSPRGRILSAPSITGSDFREGQLSNGGPVDNSTPRDWLIQSAGVRCISRMGSRQMAATKKLTSGQKAAQTRKRRAAGRKAAATRKRRATAAKAAATRKKNAATRKKKKA
jgi:hypothetical protein